MWQELRNCNFTSMSTILITLDTSKLFFEYVVVEKKIEKICSLYIMSVQIPKSLPSELLDKNRCYTYNLLYVIILPNI